MTTARPLWEGSPAGSPQSVRQGETGTAHLYEPGAAGLGIDSRDSASHKRSGSGPESPPLRLPGQPRRVDGLSLPDQSRPGFVVWAFATFRVPTPLAS